MKNCFNLMIIWHGHNPLFFFLVMKAQLNRGTYLLIWDIHIYSYKYKTSRDIDTFGRDKN